MIFPITPILDDFNRADESPLSGGGDWPSRLGNTIFTLSLVSNQAISQATQDAAATRAWSGGSSESLGSDHEVWVTIGGSWTGNARVGVCTRIRGASGSAANGYRLLAHKPTNVVDLVRFAGGAFTSLHSESFTLVAGDKIGLRSIGTDHYMYVFSSGAWQLLEIVSDATFVGQTYDLALWMHTQLPRADDFGGGNIRLPQIIRHRSMVAAPSS